MIYSLLELLKKGAFNGSKFMFLTLINEKLTSFYCLKLFNNNFLFIKVRGIILPPLDVFYYNNFNKL